MCRARVDPEAAAYYPCLAFLNEADNLTLLLNRCGIALERVAITDRQVELRKGARALSSTAEGGTDLEDRSWDAILMISIMEYIAVVGTAARILARVLNSQTSHSMRVARSI
jgi:hypothetical protein